LIFVGSSKKGFFGADLHIYLLVILYSVSFK